jgi:tetratricopeptide (TPR) repeat protein
LFLAVLVRPASFFAQTRREIDSCLQVIGTTPYDSVKLDLLNNLSFSLITSDPSLAMTLARRGLQLSDSLLKHGSATMSPDKVRGDLAIFNVIVGDVHEAMGNYPEALRYELEALHLGETYGRKKIMYYAYNNIALIYEEQGNYEDALRNHFKALDIKTGMHETPTMLAYSYDNIGVIYYKQKKLDDALASLLKAQKMLADEKDLYALAMNDRNLSAVYSDMGNYPLALDFNNRAIRISRQTHNLEGLASAYNNMGMICMRNGRLADAQRFLDSAVTIAGQINKRTQLQESYANLALLSSRQNNFKKAYELQLLSMVYKDSVLSDENNRHIAQMNARYESDKKDNEISLLNKDRENQQALASAEHYRQNIIIGAVASGLFIVVVFSLLLLGRFRITQQQKRVIEEQKLLVEEKNKSITDSIHYAKRIQRSLLPTEKYIVRVLAEKAEKQDA